MTGVRETGLAPDAMLVLPQARSVAVQRAADLLTLHTRDNEVTFDDPRHFAFAEGLVANGPFRAADAARWGGLGWDEAGAMLRDLVAAGVLEPAENRIRNRTLPSPLPAAPMATPRGWADGLIHDLTGTALDPAWLEVVVPVFRVAHLTLDRDGRQVGEANVFPAAARIDVPTEWRACPYTGGPDAQDGQRADRPMNVTALRAMRAHWRSMMALLLRIREAYLARFPAARAGWTVGDVERLATTALALPSLLVLRTPYGVANGDLHPALSNLFRVSDGLRMVIHQMLFVPVHEPMVGPDAPVDAAAILAYADRTHAFHSDHGVCAGPRFMIEDFLAVLLDGAAPRSGLEPALDPELEAAAAEIGAALDYALMGLRTHFATFALWPAMARAYQAIHAQLQRSQAPAAAEIARRFEGHFAALSARSFLASEDWRQHREAVYDAIFARCGTALGLTEPPLSAQIAPGPVAAEATCALRDALARRLGDTVAAAGMAAVVTDFLARAQRIVALAETLQAPLGRHLGRPAPAHRLTLAHINLHNVLMGQDVRTVPFLPDELAHLFGVTIHVDAASILISDGPAPVRSSHSPGLAPADTVCPHTSQRRENP